MQFLAHLKLALYEIQRYHERRWKCKDRQQKLYELLIILGDIERLSVALFLYGR